MRAPTGYETRHCAHDALATHRHATAYAALVLDGSYVEASADGPVICKPGTLVLHPRWHAHGNRFGRHGAKVVNLELGAGEAADALRILRVEDVREAAAVFTRAPHHLPGLIAASRPVELPALPAWQQRFLQGLVHESSGISQLAHRVGVSPAHASRAFVASHGMPPQVLRRELRCRDAIALLAGGLPLAEVAARSGFADQAHLGRTLRAMTGATPRQLRAQIKCVQDTGSAPLLQ